MARLGAGVVTEPTAKTETDGTTEALSVADEAFRKRSHALGDPTRYAIYRAIARRDLPVSVAELTDAFDLNHNTIRQHLAELRDAGLVEDVPDAPQGPGRPRIRYRLTAEAAGEWNDEGPYERLSLLLLEVASTGASALEVGRSAGKRVPLDHAADDPLAAMTAAMTAQGFAPQVVSDDARAELVLGHCPFASAAEVDPQVVCLLHRGMLEGLAAQIDGVAVSDLVANDPRHAGCRVLVDRVPDRG